MNTILYCEPVAIKTASLENVFVEAVGVHLNEQSVPVTLENFDANVTIDTIFYKKVEKKFNEYPHIIEKDGTERIDESQPVEVTSYDLVEVARDNIKKANLVEKLGSEDQLEDVIYILRSGQKGFATPESEAKKKQVIKMLGDAYGYKFLI